MSILMMRPRTPKSTIAAFGTFYARTAYDAVSGTTKNYRVFVPGQAATRPMPVIVQLHGASASNNSNDNVYHVETAGELGDFVGWSPTRTTSKRRDVTPYGVNRWQFVTIFPQKATGSPEIAISMRYIPLMVAQTLAEFSCDPLQVHYSGLSAGAIQGFALVANNLAGLDGASFKYASFLNVSGGLSGVYFDSTNNPFWTGATLSDTEARDYCATLFATNSLLFRWHTGDFSATTLSGTEYTINQLVLTQRGAFTAGYAAAGISSKFSHDTNWSLAAAYGGEVWDHGLSWNRIYDYAPVWAELLTSHR